MIKAQFFKLKDGGPESQSFFQIEAENDLKMVPQIDAKVKELMVLGMMFGKDFDITMEEIGNYNVFYYGSH